MTYVWENGRLIQCTSATSPLVEASTRRSPEQLARSLMPRFWSLRVISTRRQPPWEARARGMFGMASSSGESRQQALDGLINQLAWLRLPKTLAAAGWHAVRREVDQAEVLVALDPSGEQWAVTIGDPDDPDVRRIVRGVLGSESPAKIAVIEPLAARTAPDFLAAIEQSAN